MDFLGNYLKNNNHNMDDVTNIVYISIMLSLFETIFEYLENDNKQVFKNRLRKCKTPISERFVFEELFKKTINVHLEDYEFQWLVNLVNAYLRKSNDRKRITEQIKSVILIKQDYKCIACHAPIDKNKMQVDHYIPFKYVGDELQDNFVGLCEACNKSKGANLLFLFKVFLIHKVTLKMPGLFEQSQ